jgi:hypothetical protein
LWKKWLGLISTFKFEIRFFFFKLTFIFIHRLNINCCYWIKRVRVSCWLTVEWWHELKDLMVFMPHELVSMWNYTLFENDAGNEISSERRWNVTKSILYIYSSLFPVLRESKALFSLSSVSYCVSKSGACVCVRSWPKYNRFHFSSNSSIQNKL